MRRRRRRTCEKRETRRPTAATGGREWVDVQLPSGSGRLVAGVLVGVCVAILGACQGDSGNAEDARGGRDTRGDTVRADLHQREDSSTAPDSAEIEDVGDARDVRADSDGGQPPPRDPESKFERDPGLPVSCDPSDPDVEIIGPNTYSKHDPFQKALNAKDKRIFCLKPGDYRGLSGKWGIFLKTAGTAQKPRYLVYHNPSMPRDRHPWNMDDPDDKTGAKRVLLPGVRVRASHWTLDRLRFDSSSGGVKVKGAHHVVVNRSMFYRMPGDPDVQAVSVEDAHHVWIQNSVLGDFPQWDVGKEVCCGFERGTSGDDNLALLVVDSDHIFFVDNEAWDPFNGDIVQTQAVNTQQNKIVRTVIADNDMWLTDDLKDEPYENAIDFKKGPDAGPKSEWAVIQNNRIWNFSNDPKQMSWNVISTHAESNTTGFLIRDNILWDNKAAAISLSIEESETVIEGNVIHDQKPQNVGGKGGIIVGPAGESRLERNILVHAETDELWGEGGNAPHDVKVRHNVFIDSDVDVPQHEPANTIEENAFFDSKPFQGNNPNSIVRSGAGAANHGELKVNVREITGPKTVRIPNAKVTPRSPHSGWFQSN